MAKRAVEVHFAARSKAGGRKEIVLCDGARGEGAERGPALHVAVEA